MFQKILTSAPNLEWLGIPADRWGQILNLATILCPELLGDVGSDSLRQDTWDVCPKLTTIVIFWEGNDKPHKAVSLLCRALMGYRCGVGGLKCLGIRQEDRFIYKLSQSNTANQHVAGGGLIRHIIRKLLNSPENP